MLKMDSELATEASEKRCPVFINMVKYSVGVGSGSAGH